MSRFFNIKTLARSLNALELISVFITLFAAFTFQVIYDELPCPLCLLQRVGFLGVAFGFILNLRFGLRPSHYAISLLSGLFTSFVALRQIALHVIPGSGAYGDALFGFHLYTWSFIIAITLVIVITLMMIADKQYQLSDAQVKIGRYSRLLFACLFMLTLANIISVLLECGFLTCPDNPTHYL